MDINDINKLYQSLDNLKIQDEKARNFQQSQMKKNNSINPENYYPNPNNASSKNVTYFTTTINPNTLSNDEYYNDEYYNGNSSYGNSNVNSNINTPITTDYYYNKGGSYSSSQSSLGSMGEKKMKNIEQLKIQTNSRSHSRTQSNGSDIIPFSPRNYNRDRRGSQDTIGSSIFSPTSSNCSYSQSSASLSENMTASIKSDINSITLQNLSFDLVSGWLSRITSSAGFIKNTKRYYFVLDSDGLYYFKTNDPFARAKGFIKFDTRTKIKDIKENSPAKDKSSKLLELEVYKENKSHQVVLQAEDPEDRDMWHRALKKMIVRQKYVNQELPPIPQTPQTGNTQPVPIPSYGANSPGSRSRSQSQSSRNMPPQSPNLSYSQQLRLTQQKMYHDNNYDNLPLSKKSSLQNISDINLAAPNILALQNGRRPSFDIQMLRQHHHSRTSSISSLNESNRHRYSYNSGQPLGSNSHFNN